MDRRRFLKGGALAAATAAMKPPTSAADVHPREFVLQNAQLAWHVQSAANGVRSTAFENRLSGRHFALQSENEFRLTFSRGNRLEIPWWDFRLSDETPVSPERESGLMQGFNRAAGDAEGWRPVYNLSGGQHGRAYGGYGWFRCNIELPASAQGKDIVFVLGGYDEQDWNDYWVYFNGQQIGRRTSAGRWRRPGRFTLRPSDPLYALLHFGSSNLLAVRTRAYNFHLENTPEKAIDRYVFRPWLFDQFVSIGEPFLSVSSFAIRDSHQENPEKLRINLFNAEHRLSVDAHYELDGIARRKWLEIRNESDQECLLLDVELDAFQLEAHRSEGGQGEPVFIDNEVFLAIAHPAGINEGTDTQIHLWHSPGTKIQPGQTFKTAVSLVGVTERNKLLGDFHTYIISQSPRNKRKRVSLYTCYGINNQWGPCPPLTDVETLNVQGIIKRWQAKDVKFDYFTLDQGWPDNDGDLTQFASACYPDGPEKIVEGVKALDMKLGLWFSVSGGGWSDGSYPAVQASAIPQPGASGDPPTTPPVWSYRDGYPTQGGVGRTLCIASDPYFNVFKKAVDHHVQHNGVRLVKFDIGDYYCNSTAHQHMPGRYSTESMFNRLIDLAGGVRSIAQDAFVVWYWGVGRSPFWAMHGDVIFESGLFLEGSGTSWFPTMYYRDAVTLALDQSTVFASLIPPLLKDSLGVWLSQIRWANFMGKERWREAMVMDLGRGNLMFPQIWGDPYLLNDDDLHFLAGLMALAHDNEQIFLKPRRDVGDPWQNTPYGYAFLDGQRGFVFLNNVHFIARKVSLPLGADLGLSGPSGTALRIVSRFPEMQELASENDTAWQSGETVEIWMRPFETLLLEIGAAAGTPLPRRQINAAAAANFGTGLDLQKAPAADWMNLIFADAARFERDKMHKGIEVFSSRLPVLPEGRSILAIQVELTKDGEEYRHALVVAEIIIIRARIGDHDIQFTAVPSPRQYGNTQHAGCSWIVYKITLAQTLSNQPLEFAVHSYLPDRVTCATKAWVVKHWWQEDTRPEAEGYFAEEPS
ncbi:MAG: hypothetical protein WA510_14540 [Acidobacteriaceae bacterium]